MAVMESKRKDSGDRREIISGSHTDIQTYKHLDNTYISAHTRKQASKRTHTQMGN